MMKNMTGKHRKAFWVGKTLCKHGDLKIWTLPIQEQPLAHACVALHWGQDGQSLFVPPQ